MNCDVRFSKRANKQAGLLKRKVTLVLQALVVDLQTKGPAPGTYWPNYSKLYCKKQEDKRHCHLTKGRPTYVCCWKVHKSEAIIEVYYVGTHEKAPY